MKIWLVSIFENTPIDDNQNTRYNSLVLEASKRNHDVVFWTSTFKHNVKKQRFDQYKEIFFNERVKINFVPAKGYTKNISVKRLYSHYCLSQSMVNFFNQKKEIPDVIIVAFPPISTTYEVMRWAEKQKIPVIIDVIDPWPEVFVEHRKGILKKIIKLGIYPLFRKTSYIFNHCKAVIAISNQYIDFAKSYNSNLENTKCFYPAVQLDEMIIQLKKASENITKNPEELVVIYAGSLGYSYDILTIIKAAEVLEEKYSFPIKFIVAGDGPQKNIVEHYIKNHSNLIYLGRVSKEKLMEAYYKADLGLTQHISGATQSVTYKLFDLLGSGLPILNSLESEMKTIILNNKVGLHNAPGDFTQLVTNIIQCYGNRDLISEMKERALHLTALKGDSKKVYSEALDFIESIALKQEIQE